MTYLLTTSGLSYEFTPNYTSHIKVDRDAVAKELHRAGGHKRLRGC
jgi:hypothetical protein